MSSRSKPSLLPRIARFGIVAAICLSLGFHWALLQGIAWTGMLISFVSDGTVIEAVEKTFDGQHGCPLCQKVKEGQKSDQKQSQHAVQSMKKLNAVLVEFTQLIAPASEMMIFANVREIMVTRQEAPEPPPPRCGGITV